MLRYLKAINFPFGTNGKLMILGIPILMHLRVYIKRVWIDVVAALGLAILKS